MIVASLGPPQATLTSSYDRAVLDLRRLDELLGKDNTVALLHEEQSEIIGLAARLFGFATRTVRNIFIKQCTETTPLSDCFNPTQFIRALSKVLASPINREERERLYTLVVTLRLFLEMAVVKKIHHRFELTPELITELLSTLKQFTPPEIGYRQTFSAALAFEIECCCQALNMLKQNLLSETAKNVLQILSDRGIGLGAAASLGSLIPGLLQQRVEHWFPLALTSNWLKVLAMENRVVFLDVRDALAPHLSRVSVARVAVEFFKTVFSFGEESVAVEAVKGKPGLITLLNFRAHGKTKTIKAGARKVAAALASRKDTGRWHIRLRTIEALSKPPNLTTHSKVHKAAMIALDLAISYVRNGTETHKEVIAAILHAQDMNKQFLPGKEMIPPRAIPPSSSSVRTGTDALRLAKNYLFGLNGCSVDLAKAVEYIKESAELNEPEGELYLGWLCSQERGKIEVKERLEHEQNGGDIYAKTYLALWEAPYQKDNALAFSSYQKASDHGNSRAHLELALCYEAGIGTSVDLAQAFNLYQKSAENYPLGKLFLTACYEYGIGTPRHLPAAKSLFEETASPFPIVAEYLAAFYPPIPMHETAARSVKSGAPYIGKGSITGGLIGTAGGAAASTAIAGHTLGIGTAIGSGALTGFKVGGVIGSITLNPVVIGIGAGAGAGAGLIVGGAIFIGSLIWRRGRIAPLQVGPPSSSLKGLSRLHALVPPYNAAKRV